MSTTLQQPCLTLIATVLFTPYCWHDSIKHFAWGLVENCIIERIRLEALQVATLSACKSTVCVHTHQATRS